jgi:hypothetical protein
VSRREALEAILQDVVVLLLANVDRLQHKLVRVYLGEVDVAATQRQRMHIRSQSQLAG